MSSVAYMDMVIGSLVTTICLIAAPMLYFKAGGWVGLHHALPPEYFQVLGNYRMSPDHVLQPVGFGVIRGLEFLVPTMLLLLGNQVMYQKFFSAKTQRDARLSVVGWFFGAILLETLIVCIAVFGTALYHSNGELAKLPHEIIPYTARHGLPALMGALLLGAVFAQVMSAASNYLFSPATNLVNDVFSRYISPGASNKRVLIVSRLAVVLLGCWALYQSLHAASVIHTMLWAYTVYAASLTPVVLAAFFSKRVTAWGAVSAIGAGTLITVVWDIQAVKNCFPRVLADRDAIFLALPAAVAAMIVVSFFTPKPTEEQLAQFSD
jgi:SSS family solute:Na+ symporter/sodium/proline symporter